MTAIMEGLRIQVAVPYRLRPARSRHSSSIVFREGIRHQVLTLYTLAVMCAVMSLGSLAVLLTGYPRRLLLASATLVVAVFPFACVAKARKLKARELSIDPISGACTVTVTNGQQVSPFRLEEVELRIVEITHPADVGPWGFAVVLVAPGAQFPLAAVESREEAEQYVRELAGPLREKFIDEEMSAHVPRMWPRGW